MKSGFAETAEMVQYPNVNNTSIQHRVKRADLSQSNTQTTGIIEDLLPGALEGIARVLGHDWHKNLSNLLGNFGESYLTEPLCLVGTTRLETSSVSINRFCRSLLTADSYLRGDPNYDFFFGAFALPQLIQLGRAFRQIPNFRGEIEEKIKEVLNLEGEACNNSIYEMLVAGALDRAGYEVEFVKRLQTKTPDLKLLNFSDEVFVECKRKAPISDPDLEEGMFFTQVFSELRKEALGIKKWGTIEIMLATDSKLLSYNSIIRAALKALRKADKKIYAPWGTIVFYSSIPNIRFPYTPLYSPNFLRSTFGWNCEIPSHDGIVCQVEEPLQLWGEEAIKPLAIKWTNKSPEAEKRKARSLASLIFSAFEQFPDDSIGIIYGCYSELSREAIADRKTEKIFQDLSDCSHRPKILIPEVRINRLYSSPVGHGKPDTIENTLELRAGYVPEEAYQDFPCGIYTDSG